MHCVRIVGVKVHSDRPGTDTFTFQNDIFENTSGIIPKQFLKDVNNVPEFSLMLITSPIDCATKELALFLVPKQQRPLSTQGYASKSRLFSQFFCFPEENKQQPYDPPKQIENNKKKVGSSALDLALPQFYAKLSEAHLNDRLSFKVPENVQAVRLKPLLREYQRRAVLWMWHREIEIEYLESDYQEVVLKHPVHESISTSTFYYNWRTLELWDNNPGETRIPSGGILSDEMGLGKTVEMLALILNNPRIPLPHDKDIATEIATPLNTVKCVCVLLNGNDLISCTKCGLSQHKKCVWKNSLAQDACSYICPSCWKFEKPVPCGTTFIVSPYAIKRQWEAEVKKHIQIDSMRVLVYDGIANTGWISPKDLASYDIVLTDYSVIRMEMYMADSISRPSTRTLRHKEKHIKLISPLPLVEWWRVCLDEAQMVDSPIKNCAKMVKMLPAIHRWSITGTPVEKTIDDLFGQIHFLDIVPYNNPNAWRELSIPFNAGNFDPLVNVMQKIMWRTCKANVLAQIDIPPQSEIVHYVALSDLELFFYRSQHIQYALAFREKAMKFGQLSMSEMNPKTLKLILEPLRKLRQDCTIPSVFSKVEQNVVKKVLSPEELLTYLIGNSEIEAKTHLRTVISSLNGIAALHIIKNEHETAMKLYQSVLRRAEENTGTICVDSLLQIHAIHNMQLLGKFENLEFNTAKYELEYSKLEWKYIESYYSVAKEANEELQATITTSESMFAKLPKDVGLWWRNILYSLEGTARDSMIVQRVNIDIRNEYDMDFEGFASIRGINLFITIWLDKVLLLRKDTHARFEMLQHFYKLIKPKQEQTSDDASHISRLSKLALNCHLDTNSKKKKKAKSEKCPLCKAKHQMELYECVIFNKTFSCNRNQVEGTWKLSKHEMITRSILSFAKRERIVSAKDLAEGNQFLELIENIKKEYKELSKFWVEINFTMSAFDELNMCKSRLQVDRSEVNDTMSSFQIQMQMAEKDFLRYQGTLKYLEHLKKNSDPGVCPICKQLPENKYSVLLCGHHMCMVCLSHMVKFYKNHLVCCICRFRQTFKEVLYVTLKGDESNFAVKGDYSQKIINIVQTVLKLTSEEPKIKIIIFSHWEIVLKVIAKALDENAITYRARSSKFHKSIDDFKDPNANITCLLLQMIYGSKGLNLIEATHVFLVEPILNPREEQQAIGRVHRIGQTKPTFVHRFIVSKTIEENIYDTISQDASTWQNKKATTENLLKLFKLDEEPIN